MADRTPSAAISYRWRYHARLAPGTLQPGVWIESTGDSTARISDHRTMLGARFKAWRLNFGKGWRDVTVCTNPEEAMTSGR